MGIWGENWQAVRLDVRVRGHREEAKAICCFLTWAVGGAQCQDEGWGDIAVL